MKKSVNKEFEITELGQRVSELYIDPYTAFYIITALRRASQKRTTEFSYIQMACSTLELRPLPAIYKSEIDKIKSKLKNLRLELITPEPNVFEPEYDEFLKSVKMSLALNAWINEKTENYIFDKFNLMPGELYAKKDLCEWILYCAKEMAGKLNLKDIVKNIEKIRLRLKKGIKEELIPLTRIKNIGRVRARKLYENGIKNLRDIKKTDVKKLNRLLGKKLTLNLKKIL